MKDFLLNIVEWIKKHNFLLKLLFIASVMFFVINQLVSILHGMTFAKIISLTQEQGLRSILIMAVSGLIAILPMVFYDYGTLKALKLPINYKQVINDGWIINTINNLAGFGGVVGATLRMNRYGKRKENQNVVPTITKTALFMLTGLSILSLIMFANLLLEPTSPYHHYVLWLFLGSLYAPCLYLFIKFSPKNLFPEFTNKILAIFYGASLGQWLGAMFIFLVIGNQLCPDLNLMKIAPLFVAATLIGMITMVPGGMGTFDVLIILGLASMQIPKTVAVIWILFYRIFYYILPFASGILLLVHQTGRQINNALDDTPRIYLSKMAHFFITAIMYLAGIMTIIISTMPNLTLISHFFDKLLPFSFDLFDQTLNLMIGLLLIGLARGVYNKVKRAYDLSMIILSFCIVNTLVSHISIRFVLLYSVVVFCLYIARHEFYRLKFVYSWSAMFFDAIIMGGIFIFYAVIGVIANTKTKSIRHFLFFPSDDVWFSGLAGLILAMLILIALYHYLSENNEIGEQFDEQRLTPFLNGVTNTYYEHLAYLKDYDFYYYQVNNHDKVVFMFQIKANRCIVLGNPLGDPTEYKNAVEDFMTYLDLYNYQAIFYNVDQKFSLILHDLGYQFIKISELGSHKPEEQPKQMSSATKHLTLNEVYNNLEILQKISQYEEHNRNYHAFSIARYTRDFVLSSEILAYYNEKGEMIAYCTLSKPKNNQLSLMYMHALHITPAESKQFMHDILAWCNEQKYTLHLGYSPLANVGLSSYSFTEERLIRLFYIYGEKTTHFEKTYKALFPYVNYWEAAYLAYPTHQNFFIIILQIATLIFRKNRQINVLL